jgi:hypothetical protein
VNSSPQVHPGAKGRIERHGRQTLRKPISGVVTPSGGINTGRSGVTPYYRSSSWEFGRRDSAGGRRINTKLPSCRLPKNYDLDTLLAVKHERITDACVAFSFQNHTFQIRFQKNHRTEKKIVFTFSEKLGFKALYDRKYTPRQVFRF